MNSVNLKKNCYPGHTSCSLCLDIPDNHFFPQGKVARRPMSSSDDGQWSEGLISAARLVAAAAHALAEAANSLVLGHGSEERLVSSAQHVAFCTAQLLVACKVSVYKLMYSNPDL